MCNNRKMIAVFRKEIKHDYGSVIYYYILTTESIIKIALAKPKNGEAEITVSLEKSLNLYENEEFMLMFYNDISYAIDEIFNEFKAMLKKNQ